MSGAAARGGSDAGAPVGGAGPVHAAAVRAIGVAASQGHATHDELVAAVAALLAVARGAGGGGVARGAAGTAGPAPADWRGRRLAALGLTPRRRP